MGVGPSEGTLDLIPRILRCIAIGVFSTGLFAIANVRDSSYFIPSAFSGPPPGYTTTHTLARHGWPLPMRTVSLTKIGLTYSRRSEVENTEWNQGNASLNLLICLVLVVSLPLATALGWQPTLGWRFSLSALLGAMFAAAFLVSLYLSSGKTYRSPWPLTACLWTHVPLSGFALAGALRFTIERFANQLKDSKRSGSRA